MMLRTPAPLVFVLLLGFSGVPQACAAAEESASERAQVPEVAAATRLQASRQVGVPLDSAARLALLDTIIGPPLPESRAIADMGGAFRRYEIDFARFEEEQWRSCGGAKWECLNYYDRALIYYVWWRRTGNPKYRQRADALALDYRRRYLEANKYGVAHHWAMMDGVALHYLVTDDQASLKAIGQVADNFAWLARSSGYVGDPNVGDNRIQAYALKSLLLAYKLNAPSTGTSFGHPGGNDWETVLRSALNKILATRDADGQWRLAKCGAAGRATHPFMVGLLYDALIRYYDLFEKDERIPGAIKTSAEVLWRDDWIAKASAFKYVAVECPAEGSPNPAPDLNNLIVNGYAFTYWITKDQTWRTRADQIFAGAVRSGATSLAKQFNQVYSSSFRYLAWRSGA
jgi:hypothetical protein